MKLLIKRGEELRDDEVVMSMPRMLHNRMWGKDKLGAPIVTRDNPLTDAVRLKLLQGTFSPFLFRFQNTMSKEIYTNV